MKYPENRISTKFNRWKWDFRLWYNKGSVNNSISIKQILNWINLLEIMSGLWKSTKVSKLKSIYSRKTIMTLLKNGKSVWLPCVGLLLPHISLPKFVTVTRARLALLNRKCAWFSAESRILKWQWYYQWTSKFGYKWMEKTYSSDSLKCSSQFRWAADQPNI